MDVQIQLFTGLIEKYQPLIMAMMLAQARMLGFLQQFPLFSYTRIQGQVRTTFSLAIGFPLALMIEPEMGVITSQNLALLVALLAKEALIGVTLGTILGMPFWGVQAAGDFIDHERGASMVNQTDPVNASESTTSGTILLLTSLAIFTLAGGLYVIIQVIYDSYLFWPATSLTPKVNLDVFYILGLSLTLLMQIGLIVAGPALIVLLLVDLVLAFGGKASSNIQLDGESQSFKNLIILVLIPFYGIFLGQYIRGDWRAMVSFVRGLLGIG
jgi:type III secretion protein T